MIQDIYNGLIHYLFDEFAHDGHISIYGDVPRDMIAGVYQTQLRYPGNLIIHFDHVGDRDRFMDMIDEIFESPGDYLDDRVMNQFIAALEYVNGIEQPHAHSAECLSRTIHIEDPDQEPISTKIYFNTGHWWSDFNGPMPAINVDNINWNGISFNSIPDTFLDVLNKTFRIEPRPLNTRRKIILRNMLMNGWNCSPDDRQTIGGPTITAQLPPMVTEHTYNIPQYVEYEELNHANPHGFRVRVNPNGTQQIFVGNGLWAVEPRGGTQRRGTNNDIEQYDIERHQWFNETTGLYIPAYGVVEVQPENPYRGALPTIEEIQQRDAEAAATLVAQVEEVQRREQEIAEQTRLEQEAVLARANAERAIMREDELTRLRELKDQLQEILQMDEDGRLKFKAKPREPIGVNEIPEAMVKDDLQTMGYGDNGWQ